MTLVKFQVGPTYDRKMMTGYICSKGFSLSGSQVSKSLRRVNPVNQSRRREDTVRRQNPVPYDAPYYGNKLHCDQNEKLVMYGCTFFAMNDGCSSRIIKLFSMPRKNAVIIYSHFRLVFVHFFTWPSEIPWGLQCVVNYLTLFVLNFAKIRELYFASIKFRDSRKKSEQKRINFAAPAITF